MLGNVPKNLPKEEYQSFVASLHSDRKTMTIGTLAAIIASLATFFYDDDFNVLFFTVGFVLIGSIRFYFMTRFQRYFNKSDGAELPRKWEIFAIVGGLLMAICLGSWAFYTIQYSQSQFTELVAISTCLSHMVGVAARNFGADILVTSQSLAIGVPIVSAMLLTGDMWHAFLGAMFIPFFSSARYIAASIREIFFQVLRSNARVQYLAKHDILTGLPNRGTFFHLAEAKHDLCTSQSLILVLDIDDFKSINDTYGHIAGDHLLIEIAKRMTTALGDNHIVSRIGGDEFVIHYSGRIGEAKIENVSKSILSCFIEPFECLNNTLRSSCSIGIAISDDDEPDFENMFIRADLALYEAKNSGKGCYRVYSPEMNTRYIRKQKLREDIQYAIDRSEISLVYQPIFNATGSKIKCCETLARWTHPEYGSVSPDEFIQLAENVGCISQITKYVIWESIRQCASWPQSVGVSINLSPIDLRNDALANEVTKAIEHYKFDPQRLILEVTETAIMDNPQKSISVLYDLRKKGVCVALDDFGSGYANFSYLVDIHFDKLKIDRSITARILTDERSRILLNSLCDLAKKFDMLVTIEGVETISQLESIVGCGNVDEIQGWVFGVPQPADKISLLLASQHRGKTKTAKRSAA